MNPIQQTTPITPSLKTFNQSMVNAPAQNPAAPATFNGASSVNFLNTPNNSPTVISNANIVKQIPETQTKFNTLTQHLQTPNQQNNQQNIQNNGQGLYGVDQNTINNFKSANPNQDFTPEDAEYAKQSDQQEKSYYTPEANQIMSGLDNLQGRSDDLTKQTLDRIKQTYQQSQEDQRITNSRVENSVRGMLAMQGANASGSDANSLLNETIKEGQRSLNKLTNDEQGAYLDALKAQLNNDQETFAKKTQELQTIQNAKIEDAQKFNQKVQDQAQKMQDERRQAEKEDAISDVFSQGITDPVKMREALRAKGINATTKEITDTTALLSGVGGTGMIGEYNFAKSQGYKGSFTEYQDEDANRKIQVQAAAQNPDRLLTPTEAQALGVKYGTTASQAYGKEIIKPPTEQQSKDALFASRLTDANPTIDSLEQTIVNMNPISFASQKTLENTALGNTFVSDEMKQIRQAERNFATAVLRRESGAAISPSEFDTLEKQYFPQPGDDAKTLAQKKKNRLTVQNNLIKSAGPSYGANETTPSVGQQSAQTEQQAAQSLQGYLNFHSDKEGEVHQRIKVMESQLGQPVTASDFLQAFPEYSMQSFNQVGSDTKQASLTNPTKGIVLGVNIKPYATDPQHEQKIASIVNKIPSNGSFDYDAYIKSIAPQSKITGQMITNASSTYGLDPRLVLAIIQNDSSFGTKGLGARNNNPGNIAQFDNLKNPVKGYTTLQDGVLAVAKWLANHKIA